jgi:hypothetical protein
VGRARSNLTAWDMLLGTTGGWEVREGSPPGKWASLVPSLPGLYAKEISSSIIPIWVENQCLLAFLLVARAIIVLKVHVFQCSLSLLFLY